MNRINSYRAVALSLALVSPARAGLAERLAQPSRTSRSRGVPAVSLPRFTSGRGTPVMFQAGRFRAAVLGPSAVSPGAQIPALPPSAMTGSDFSREGAATALFGVSGLSRAPLILSAKGEELASPLKGLSRRSGSDEEAALAGRKISDVLLDTFESAGPRPIRAAAAAGSGEDPSREAPRMPAPRRIVPPAAAGGRSSGESAREGFPVSRSPGGGADAEKTPLSRGGVPLIVMTVLERGLVLSYATSGLGPAGRLTRQAMSFADASWDAIDREGGRAGAGRLADARLKTPARSGRHAVLERRARSAGAAANPDAEYFSFGEASEGRWIRSAFAPPAGKGFPAEEAPLGSGGARAVLSFLPLLAAAVLAERKLRY